MGGIDIGYISIPQFGTLVQASVDLLFLRLFKRFYKLGLGVGLGLGLGLGIILRLGLGTRLALGLKVGWILCITLEAIQIKFALAEDSESKTKLCRKSYIFSKISLRYAN